MVIVTTEAENILFETVSKYVGRKRYNGSPPIFNWLRKIDAEVNALEEFDNLSNGYYRYNMEHQIGIIRFKVSRPKNMTEPVFMVTDFEFNRKAIPHWQRLKIGKPGLMESIKRHKIDNLILIRKMFEYDFD